MKQPSEETQLVVVALNIENIKKDIVEIKGSVKELSGLYVTELKFEDFKKTMLETISRIEQSNNLWRWLSPTLSGFLCSLMTFLVLKYLESGMK